MDDAFEDLVDRIYEAAAMPDLWADTLSAVARFGEGAGALLFTVQGEDFRSIASPEIEGVVDAFLADGWAARNDRPARLFARQHAGFLTDLDVYTRAELDANPLFTEFLRPRGLGWGAASAIAVPSGEQIVVDVERAYADGPVPAAVVARLDALRPHLARAATLSARLRLQAVQVAAEALDLVGLPAAILGRQGQVLAMNPGAEALLLAGSLREGRRIAFAEGRADRLLAEAVAALSSGALPGARSIPLPATPERAPSVAHLLPVRRSARDLFASASAVLVVTPVARGILPGLSVLEGLFDLTAAEARVARAIAQCRTVEQIAAEAGTSPQTVRSQLKGVMAKTGVSRQAELVGLLAGAALPRL